MWRMILAAWLFLAPMTTTAFELFMLDVGEGQAILVREGKHGVLVDTGHAGHAAHVLVRLEALGIEHLDALVLTHLHPDHASGYFRLREAYPDTPVYYNGQELADDVRPDMVRWVDVALKRDPNAGVVGAGDSIRWSGPPLAVLWPDSPDGRGMNRHSLVLLADMGGATALIMGDAGGDVERRLLERGALPSAVDVLVAGHHGSKTTATPAFLERVAPRFVFVSVNRDNIRGYPAATTLSRLKAAASRVWRTDRHGERCLRLTDGRAAICP